MAYFDVQRGEVVARIVYDGLATAGKTANLCSLHAAFSKRSPEGLYVPAENARGRTLFFDWLELAAGYVDDWPLRCQILTVPGQFVHAQRRFRLLREIDAVVLVCESTPKGVAAARIARAFLDQALAFCGNTGVPVLVQANKQDLPGALSREEVALRLGGALPVIGACATSGEGVRETLISALDAARDRLRDVLRSDGPPGLRPHVETAEQLYLAMVAEEDSAEDTAATGALDAALEAVEKLT
jgi:signal recognition particle receptor subunit beta